MNLLKNLLPWHRAEATAAEHARHAAADAQADEPGPRGCGWFDSSHDLQQGLCVQEHLSPEALARELPLAAWLDLQLGGWRNAQPA